MKNVFITALVLSTITTTSAFAKVAASVETYVAECSKKVAVLDPETNLPSSSINNFSIESKIYISQDKMEEEEIYKYLSSSSDGEENDVSEDYGVARISHSKISDTEKRTKIIDTFELTNTDENGNSVVEKQSVTTDTVWKILEKTDKKEVALRISHTADGKEVKEQLLRTKSFISDSEFTVDTMTLNPQDVKRGDRQVLFSIKSCNFKKQ